MAISFGFGAGLIAVGLLAMVLPTVQDVVVLLTLSCLLPEAVVLLRTLRFISWRGAVTMLVGVAAGVPAGTVILGWTDQVLVLTLLGAFLVVVGLGFLALPTRQGGIKWPGWAAPVAGVVGGILGGMFGTGGPPVIIYYHLAGLRKTAFRGQLMVVLGTITLTRLPSYAIAGLFTTARLWSALAVFPWVLGGALAGWRFHLEVPEHVFRRLVSVLLALMGVLLLIR